VKEGKKQMKMEIKTAKFQDMVAKAAKGAGCNKVLPITSLMSIQLTSGYLRLVTTDSANTLVMQEDKIEGDDFYAVVPVEQFSKLIARTTTETIQLSLKENTLEVKGNGVYNIPLPVDEDGIVQFPMYLFEKQKDSETVFLTTIKNILAINRSSVAKTMDKPCLRGYYVSDKVISSDGFSIAVNNIKVLKKPVLISQTMMELLELNTQEKIEMFYTKGFFLFETENMIVYGPEHEGLKIYPVKETEGFLGIDIPSMCKVPSLLLKNVMDRLALFIEPYDMNGAYFTFTPEGLCITSKKSSSVEVINYQDSKDFTPFVCCLDIPMFKAQLDSLPGEFVEIWYGHPQVLKTVDGNITMILALLEDENLKGNTNADSE
jgi:hypothetical protein